MGSYVLTSQDHVANTGETLQPQETHLGEEEKDEDHAVNNSENLDDMDEYEERIERGDFDRDVDDHELVPNFEEENMEYHDESDADNEIGIQHDTNTTTAYTPPAESTQILGKIWLILHVFRYHLFLLGKMGCILVKG